MTTGDSSQRAHRSSTRDAPRSKRSGLHSRSPSTSSRSSGAISRSRSRERPSQNRRSRSASRSRKSRHSSHRSRRSRSRSIGRDHKSRRENREYSSRHRERDRDRGRDSDRRSGSSRKRSRRDHSRSRSRSTNRRRRSHRDSSPHADENGRDRRQRRRRGSDPASTEKEVEIESVPTVATDTSPVVPVPPQEETKSEPVTQLISKTVNGDGQEQQDTPTSQESLATTTASIAASSQGDVEVLTSKAPPVSQNSITDDHKSAPAEPSNTSAKCVVPPVKVDVKSIKMDIMKALADARNTIAGIKNSASPAAAATAADTSKGVGPTQAEQPTESESTIENVSVEEIALLPQASVVDQQPQPTQASAAKPISPLKQQVSAAEVDEFDMFSAAELHGAGLSLSPATAPAVIAVGAAVQSNYDDADGYYKPSIGEILNGSYRVLGTVGKGVFSTVLRCQRIASTTVDPEIVAIKLIRNNDIMRDAAQTEIKILTHLSERDARDKKHCVRLLDRFEHRNHVALVFESMQMNVREAMKKFGGKGGISIQAVRIFCKHLLIALSHLDACSVVHADIKPDNILLDEKQTMIKMCDFGSAFESNGGKHDPTPYLVSRFYRAPEIVLGLPYDKAVDMWSVGCCLYEMFTGKVMFPGATNNEMLKLFMELKGKVPNKIIKKHRQAYIEQFQMEPHFTEDNKFCSHEIDRVTGKAVLRLMDAMKTRFDLGGALLSAKSSTDDRKQVLELRNLLERMFTLDAAKRISPKEALAHPFVKTEGKHAA